MALHYALLFLLETSIPHRPNPQSATIGQWTQVTSGAAFSPRDTASGAVFLNQLWLSNGYPDAAMDLWSSSDGVQWTRVVEPTPYDLYSSIVEYGGKLWAVNATVWNSDDGVNWTEVLASAPFFYKANVVVFDNKMWALGNGPEVWWSTDGVNWTAATLNAPYGEREASAVAAFDGKLWLMGGSTPAPGKGYSNPFGLGYPDIDMNNDVWSSPDGTNWTLVTQHAPWIGRMWFAAQSYAGRLWIMGGYDNDAYENRGDTWFTTDGVHWIQQQQTDPSWSPRHFPTTYVFNDSLWIAAGNSWPFQNDVWKLTATPPLATTTTVSGDPQPAYAGQSLTLTAAVSPDSATGTVSFMEGSTVLGTANVANGTATLATPPLAQGTHAIAASYSGDSDYNSSSATANTQMLPDNPPSVAASFAAAQIPLNGTTALTFTITNPNPVPLTGVGFSDVLGSGLTVATPNGMSGACFGGTIVAGEGTANISLSGSALPAGAQCTFAVNVTGTALGTQTTVTGTSISDQASSTTTSTAQIDVMSPPRVDLSFNPPIIPLNGTTGLTFTITNPASNPSSITSIGVSDTLPSGVVIANPNGLTGSCGDSIVAAAGGTAVAMTGLSLAPGASCTFSVTVLAVNTGTLNDSASAASPNAGSSDGTASLNVLGPDLTIAKTHTGDFTQGASGMSYTITVMNRGQAATEGTITVVDTLPAGLTAKAISGAGWTCALSTLTCARSDSLAAGATAPLITLLVDVASNATNVVNSVTVSGGSDTDDSNNSAEDPTTIQLNPLGGATGLTATATSSSQVIISWNPVTDAANYQIFRSARLAAFVPIGITSLTTFTDSQLSPDTAYLYEVRALSASNQSGPPSNIDVATTTIFDDDPIVAGSTVIKAVHFIQLRTAVNAMLIAAGLTSAVYTDDCSPNTVIRAIDITELRSNLNTARSILALPQMIYTDPGPSAADSIRAVDIQDLRAGVK